jgi:hypothetical protein
VRPGGRGMKRRSYRKLQADHQPDHHHNVYVVLLDPAAAHQNRLLVFRAVLTEILHEA